MSEKKPTEISGSNWTGEQLRELLQATQTRATFDAELDYYDEGPDRNARIERLGNRGMIKPAHSKGFHKF